MDKSEMIAMKRRNVIKNIAIIFLAIMLVLTLFSNTIMNYSLTEVSSQMIYSDSITSKVRGTGTVESTDDYSVVINETRKIASVNVKTNGEVSTGDVLFTFAEGESEELDSKRTELETAEQTYDSDVLSAGLTLAQRTAIENGNVPTLAEMQSQLATAQSAIDSAQDIVDSLNSRINTTTTVDTSAEQAALITAQQNKIAMDANVTAAQTTLEEASNDLTAAKESGDETEIANAKAAYQTAFDNYTKAQQDVIPYEQAVTNAQDALTAKTASAADSGTSAELTAAQAKLEAAQTAKETLLTLLTNEVKLAYSYEEIQEMKAEVAEMEADALGGELTSPISGTVTSIAYTAGQTPEAGETLMTIKPENKGFQMKFTVDTNQAKKIKNGDEATILNNWYGDDITGSVSSIHKAAGSADEYEVVVTLEGDVNVGDSYTVSIGEKSANYDYIVPTSSIREDSNGKYILTVTSKNTALGNRYYATRVDVEILASDDTYSAVSGAIEYGDYVITTTTKPIEIGQQVRLADQES